MTKPAEAAVPRGAMQSLPPVDELALAVGIGLVLFLRPWFDGITYPEYNVPFTWACSALAAFWAAMVWIGRMQVRFLFPVSLLAVFLFVAVITSRSTIQYDNTYRGLINWSGYLLLFCVAANGLRSRVSIGIVIGLFALTSVAEAVYAVLHISYVMPRTREAVLRDPSLVQTYFGTDRLTPEMSARMESNRAYGSLLFANALACWLLTGIPIAVAATNGLYLRLAELLARARAAGSKSPRDPRQSARLLYATLAIGAMVFTAATLYYTVYFFFVNGPGVNMSVSPVRWVIYCVAVPLAITVAAAAFGLRNGAAAMMIAVAMIGMGLFGVTAVYGLGATYSRGGILASVASLAVLATLMYRRKAAVPSKAARRAAAALILVALLLPFAHLAAAQQQDTPVPPAQSASSPVGSLSLQGVNPSWQAMTDPHTALLRFGYWISGLRMFAAYPLTGVGLGNFGVAYPRYQLLGAGDVKPAHNDYLQAACETGIFGLAAFLAFWLFFTVSNARGILGETDRSARWFRAGVFSGVIGFLLHSFVDFNFFNASLAALAFALAGLTYALTPAGAATPTPGARLAALAILALVAWTVYAGSRVTSVDHTLGRDVTRRVRLTTVEMMLNENSGNRNPNVPLAMYEATVALLIEDPAVRDSMGDILIPTGPNTYRRPQKDEPLPPSARRIMQPENRAVIRKAALDAIPVWIDRCIKADARYPHDPDLSAHIVQWYDKLREYSPDPAEKVRAADEEIRWSEICIQRSPLQTAYYDALAKALWSRGELETTAKQLDYYDRAIENWRKRTELYPVKSVVWRELAQQCIPYGQQRLKAGDTVGGQRLIDEGNRANQRADEIDAEIRKMTLGHG